MIDDSGLRALAARQHGVVSYEQVRGEGVTKSQRRYLIDGARWERLAGRVLRLVGTTDTLEQRFSYAVLAAGPGAALAGESAAFHSGVRGARRDPIQVARPRGHISRASSHEPTLLPEQHVMVVDGIRTVSPSRAIFDIAGSVEAGAEKPWHLERIERLLNNAATDLLITEPSMMSMLDDMAQRGRPGIKVMRLVLGKVDLSSPTASGIETRVVQICRRYGLPELRRQVNVGDDEGWIGRVDFAARDVPFVLEVQSERFHTSPLDRRKDAERVQRLEDAGFEVEQVSDTQVWHHAEDVARLIRSGLARAACRAHPGSHAG